MDRIVFLNGAFLRLEDAHVSIMDRGFLFADGVYEVSAVIGGGLIDNASHLRRLEGSLAALGIPDPYPAETWTRHQLALVRRNALDEGLVYMQVTRGVAEREFAVAGVTAPTIVMFTQQKAIVGSTLAHSGAAVITVPDIRWARRDIKSVALLAQVMAKQAAAAAGAQEAFMVEDGVITEGASSTAFIVTASNVIVTRPLSTSVLPSVTREAMLHLAAEHQMRVEQRAFTVTEARAAAEVFYTSASSLAMPVVSIDGQAIGAGHPGPVAARLRNLYLDLARRTAVYDAAPAEG